MINKEIYIVILILLLGMIGSMVTRKLTIAGAITGAVIGLLTFLGTGWTGLVLMTAFFMMGTLATSWKSSDKIRMGIIKKNEERRKAGQVLANAGAAAIVSLLALIKPDWQSLMLLMLAAAFSSASADTVSSELGTLYGKKFYNIITMKKDQRGLDGVVSLEGFIAGLFASLIIALIYMTMVGYSANFFWIIIAGTIGNIFDSLVGATAERRDLIKNDWVNFLNTVAAAGVILLVYQLGFMNADS